MQELFAEHLNKYELRNKRSWVLPNTRTINYGKETIRYRGPKTWDLLPNDIKESESLELFKKKSKTGHHMDANVGYAKPMFLILVLYKELFLG